MNRFLKFIAYLGLFVVSFFIFLYWMFPYDTLKERLISGVERQLGANIEVSAGELEPYWLTGVEVEKLEFNIRDEKGNAQTALALDKVRMRAAMFSLLIGNPRISYLVRAGKGEIEGRARQTADGVEFDAEFDDFDIASIGILSSAYGLNISGKIDGYVEMEFDRRRPARSSGKLSVDLKDFKLAASEAKLGPLEMPLPPLVLTASKGSSIKIEVGKGAVVVDKFVLKDGDLGIDISGKVFLSNTLPNSRFNLSGAFTASEALNQALPFLFVVEKQKRPDGSYPLSVTGRVSSPMIRVGTFTLPL